MNKKIKRVSDETLKKLGKLGMSQGWFVRFFHNITNEIKRDVRLHNKGVGAGVNIDFRLSVVFTIITEGDESTNFDAKIFDVKIQVHSRTPIKSIVNSVRNISIQFLYLY